MAKAFDRKEQETLDTPLLLFESRCWDGWIERWSTHRVSFGGNNYEARILRHNAFEVRSSFEDGLESSGRLTVTLGNVDGHISQIDGAHGFKGAQLTVRFIFFDLLAGAATTDPQTVFLGLGDRPELSGESEIRISFSNRLNLQAVVLPKVRVESRCPWIFPADAAQRQLALGANADQESSPFHACGYSTDQPGGCGNLSSDAPYSSCSYGKADCEARGMYSKDSQNRTTARFGGFQYLPPSVAVRTSGDKNWHQSDIIDNRAMTNDAVPLLYGTSWFSAPVVLARNDGNLTRMEVLLGSGPIEGVLKVLVNGVEIPLAQDGTDMTATGWYRQVTDGSRTGAFNPDFSGSSGTEGDPHGGIAILSIVTPNRISAGVTAPRVQVLANGLKLRRFGPSGNLLDRVFTRNPAWILLDVLQRTGWRLDELDLPSFGAAADHCDDVIQATDAYGSARNIPRFETNIALTRRRSVAEVVRGVRASAALHLAFTQEGRISLRAERGIAQEQPTLPLGSNSSQALDSGWPAYEFGDGTNGYGGILRRQDGSSSLSFSSLSLAQSPNRLSLEFQDALNEYQQDSVSVVDVDDVQRCGQERSAAYSALGVANANQAARLLRFLLLKKSDGNLFADFETSVKGLALRPGDLITISQSRSGYYRSLWRILAVSPGTNYARVRIQAQFHNESWYAGLSGNSEVDASGRRQANSGGSTPQPLCGVVPNPGGEAHFGVVEQPLGDGSTLGLSVRFQPPRNLGGTRPGIPIIDLIPVIELDQGGLQGGQSYYYAVTALDASGNESPLSFAVRATVPTVAAHGSVTLAGLSFPNEATGYRLYRGASPQKYFLIEEGTGRPLELTDAGAAAQPFPPPDVNYDHANFYWRFEKIPETACTIFTSTTVGNSDLHMPDNEYRGSVVRITAGKGAGQERLVAGNDGATATLKQSWNIVPDTTSKFCIAESDWRYVGLTRSDNILVLVPNQPGHTVQLLGVSANARDEECPFELSPLTPWRLIGSTNGGVDSDVPGLPFFTIAPLSGSTVELGPVGFESPDNTRTITAGTLSLYYWNELLSPSPIRLTQTLGSADVLINVEPQVNASLNSVIQVEDELMRVVELVEAGTQFRVDRGIWGSTAALHTNEKPVYLLTRKTAVVPFVKDFFGSPASGSFSYPIYLGDARVAGATFFVTNSVGDSQTRSGALTATTDGGLRVLAGGQYSIQMQGLLTEEGSIAPPLVVEMNRAVRDVSAMVGQAPIGAPVGIRVKVDEATYCELVIPAGQNQSNTVSGFGVAPLSAGAKITVEIISLGHTQGTAPGSDLTVTLRM